MNKKIFLLTSLILGSIITRSQDAESSTEFFQRKKSESVLMPKDELILTELSDVTISENGWYVNSLQLHGNDMLLAHGQSWKSKDQPNEWWQVSVDGGVKWNPYVASVDKDHTLIPFCLCQLHNNSVIGWSGSWNRDIKFEGRPGQPVKQSIMRAPSSDAIIRGHGVKEDVTISLPYMVPLTGDDIENPAVYIPATWGKMIEVDHGHLIQATYPRLAYDNSPRLWNEQKSPAFKYRTCVIYSQDEGTTWNYLATVASPEQYPLPSQAEGYCEPDLLHFGGGHLLCVMRSGGNPGGNMSERYTPLVSSHSLDGGLTWSQPESIAPYGVAPVLLQLKNGLVVCLSGRPGFFLIFSNDKGRSWSTPHWISKSDGAWSRSSSGYGQLIELETGVLGIAYDEYTGEGTDACMVTKFRRYRVE